MLACSVLPWWLAILMIAGPVVIAGVSALALFGLLVAAFRFIDSSK